MRTSLSRVWKREKHSTCFGQYPAVRRIRQVAQVGAARARQVNRVNPTMRRWDTRVEVPQPRALVAGHGRPARGAHAHGSASPTPWLLNAHRAKGPLGVVRLTASDPWARLWMSPFAALHWLAASRWPFTTVGGGPVDQS